MFAGNQPAAIIIDEVDGMSAGPGGGIRELLKMIEATEPHSQVYNRIVNKASEKQMARIRQDKGKPKGRPDSGEGEGGQGKKGKAKLGITRPIICIANDLVRRFPSFHAAVTYSLLTP